MYPDVNEMYIRIKKKVTFGCMYCKHVYTSSISVELKSRQKRKK